MIAFIGPCILFEVTPCIYLLSAPNGQEHLSTGICQELNVTSVVEIPTCDLGFVRKD